MRGFGAFWILIGAGISVTFGVALDNILLGIGIGAAVGVLLDATQNMPWQSDGEDGDEE
jgi:hypothetical protein